MAAEVRRMNEPNDITQFNPVAEALGIKTFTQKDINELYKEFIEDLDKIFQGEPLGTIIRKYQQRLGQ